MPSTTNWVDAILACLSLFVTYMLAAFEFCLVDEELFRAVLSEVEQKLLSCMNKVGIHAEITTQKAAGILQRSENATRTVPNDLVNKGYLDVDTSKVPFIYRLQQHLPE